VSGEQSWTIGRLLEWTTQFLAGKGVESPRLDTEVLLAQALDCKRIDLYVRYTEDAAADARQRFRELIRQRMEGTPVAYLVGRKEFYSLAFEVSRDVLIPRADTHALVDACLRLARPMTAPRVLDVGTGSGNLAVAVAHQHKTAQVTAIDVSASALAVAARNAAKHGVAERIRFVEGDLFAGLPADEPFDFILSNPPYIPTAEMAGLMASVRDHEPRVALDGGPDGLVIFDRLLAEAPAYLTPEGYLIVEIGSPQQDEARARLRRTGYELTSSLGGGPGQACILCARRRH
jgi:release factor glutamine methyltransferase